MSTDEDWDTSEVEVGDKFNTFHPGKANEAAAASTPTPAPEPLLPPVNDEGNKVEEVAQEMEKVAVSEAPAAPAPEKAAPAPKSAAPAPAAPATDHRKHSLRPQRSDGTGEKAFTEALDPEALEYFNDLTQKKFSDQAVAFLNAYWQEIGDQADFIFEVAWETMKYADMHTKGVNYIHLYDEGNDLDFNIGLYFYEKLCKLTLNDAEGKKWRDDPKYKVSMPTMMTAIVRKKELRDKVDVNFDGRISFLEYLLYQYEEYANPADFTHRSMKFDEAEHPAITKARQALEDVNAAIQKYEAEKTRLEELAAKPGVRGLGAKHQLAILHASPLAEELNKALITAEAAVRIAVKKFHGVKGGAGGDGAGSSAKPTQGSVFWLKKDLEVKKKLYGR